MEGKCSHFTSTYVSVMPTIPHFTLTYFVSCQHYHTIPQHTSVSCQHFHIILNILCFILTLPHIL